MKWVLLLSQHSSHESNTSFFNYCHFKHIASKDQVKTIYYNLLNYLNSKPNIENLFVSGDFNFYTTKDIELTYQSKFNRFKLTEK